MRGPRVEILSFEGCPSREAARAQVLAVAAELGVEPDLELVQVADPGQAVQLRFLGSPTVRVNGRDVEPGAGERDEFALSCRVYRTEHGPSGVPDARWLREALGDAAAGSRLGPAPPEGG